jgi:hypothetical protein
MSEQVLGYERKGLNWEPIHECKRGYIYTAAFVMCSQCRAAIRSMGGPNSKAWCISCKEKQEKIEKDLDDL